MSWKRIIKYTLILFIVTFAVSFPFGYIDGFLTSRGRSIPQWFGAVHFISMVLSSIAVFIFLSRSESDDVWKSAFTVATLSWILSFPINVLAIGQPILVWAVSLFYTLWFMAIGVPIGRKLIKKESS